MEQTVCISMHLPYRVKGPDAFGMRLHSLLSFICVREMKALVRQHGSLAGLY